MSEQPLLIELGSEELPPKSLDKLAAVLAAEISRGLEKQGIAADTANRQVWCTPRRLAVLIPQVAAVQAEQHIERRGPSVKAGSDEEGKPTRALIGFASSCGVTPDDLQIMETPKGQWYVYRNREPGQPLAALLPGILAEAIKQLPIPRPMRWGHSDYRFVRPPHWLVILHGSQVIPATLMGLESGRRSRGHRFHHPDWVTVEHADQWLDTMHKAYVLADPAQRRTRIKNQVATIVDKGEPRLSDALLDELANLVEWPVAIACRFESEFLQVPAEALITTMESDQKFIPVFTDEGQLGDQFIGIANIESRQPEEVRQGYERVIRPRFADARFFYQEDLKTPLEQLQGDLERVTYQKSLGSLWDKTCRVAELSRIIAGRVGADPQNAMRAASLCKSDLLTRMVGEFPSLQGTMGRYYAQAQGERGDVAWALDEYYMPRHAGDPIAAGKLSQVVALADRLDTLCGVFAVGLKPTGNKDPFALRRAALSLVRTLIEGDLALDLDGHIREALELLPDSALEAGLKADKQGNKPPLDVVAQRKAIRLDLLAFIHERLRSYCQDKGFSHNQFEAVAAIEPLTLVDFMHRLAAVADFSRRAEAANLAEANKRVANILHKQRESGVTATATLDKTLLVETAEQALVQALEEVGEASDQAMDTHNYTHALAHLAKLQAPVDAFFEQVMVNADDAAVRTNRLALLTALQNRFLLIADIAKL